MKPKTLPDHLAPGLDIVSIGINPSLYSVERGFYFARPGNRFWPTLNASGLVPEPLEPSRGAVVRLFRVHRIGFTDLVKRATTRADELTPLAALAVVHATVQAQQPTATSSPDTLARLQAVAGGTHRSDADRARDRYRHPVETLAFFGIREDLTVVEIWPGGGWYTRILAPLLKDQGKLYLAAYKPGFIIRNATNAQREEVAAKPEVFGKPVFTVLEKGEYAIAPPGSVDLVLTFRNLHNWMDDGNAEDVIRAMYRALKPGGVLGFVEHRANPGAQDPRAKSGYVTEEYTIKLVESAGFRLVAKSEINANPKDTKDHPKGVWTLPPSYALKDVDREKYAAIGESDRMTLKFVKPAN